MIINNNEDLKIFAQKLARDLEKGGDIELAKELSLWTEDFFTTSSEFLGELKLILEKVKALKYLTNSNQNDVEECLNLINKAFRA